ncbi:hypothetical protein [Phycicoccus flavus]|uniref:hypothetical protein n=1 Tax=Phycicoccus flavus TaxID=2502783 RepID=UPI000FEBFE7D|nr:hypothetical protein [Phycicoccus flavus]NHA67708.1 hypothetical protein [Phycicoccus flavus]
MNPRIIRAIGSALVVLGFGSPFMRQAGFDTVLTAWMGPAQPWSGICMGVVGLVLAVVGTRWMNAAAVATD